MTVGVQVACMVYLVPELMPHIPLPFVLPIFQASQLLSYITIVNHYINPHFTDTTIVKLSSDMCYR